MFASQRMRVGLFDDYLQGMNKIWGNVGWWIGAQGDSLSNYLKEHYRLAALLSGVAIAAYGFELFNLNLTIDEEIHAFASQDTMWIAQGRWGMFVLNRLLIPYPIIPFVPLFVALLSHVAAVLILLSPDAASYAVDSCPNQVDMTLPSWIVSMSQGSVVGLVSLAGLGIGHNPPHRAIGR